MPSREIAFAPVVLGAMLRPCVFLRCQPMRNRPDLNQCGGAFLTTRIALSELPVALLPSRSGEPRCVPSPSLRGQKRAIGAGEALCARLTVRGQRQSVGPDRRPLHHARAFGRAEVVAQPSGFQHGITSTSTSSIRGNLTKRVRSGVTHVSELIAAIDWVHCSPQHADQAFHQDRLACDILQSAIRTTTHSSSNQHALLY